MSVAQAIAFWIFSVFVCCIRSHFWRQQRWWWRHRLLLTWICMLSWLFILVCAIFLVYSYEMFPILMEWKNTFRLQKYLGGLYMVDCWCYYCGFPYHPTRSCISCSVFSTLTRACYTFVLPSIRLHGFLPKSLYTKNESQALQKKHHQKWNNILPRSKTTKRALKKWIWKRWHKAYTHIALADTRMQM